MSMTFLFWLSAIYTMALFAVQVAEFITGGHVQINVSTANAFYLALLSAYVGGKEIKRWTIGFKPEEQATESQDGQATPFRLRGEWFVGLWALFLLVANLGSEFWPGRLAYPKGLTLIAFEVLGFYIGSSASRWLNVRVDEKAHQELQTQLESEEKTGTSSPTSTSPGSGSRWVSRKRERYEKTILDAVSKKGGLRREHIEALLGLSRAATLRILGGLIDRGALKRTGDLGDPTTLYQPTSAV